MPINYKRATLADLGALIELGVELNKFNRQHDLEENLFWDGWENDFQVETAAELEAEHNYIYLAETEDGTPVGYVVVRKCDTCGHFEVDQLFVKEDYRSQKVGKGLMQLVIEEAKNANMPLKLEVYSTNTHAINFYKNLGFKEEGVVLKLEFD